MKRLWIGIGLVLVVVLAIVIVVTQTEIESKAIKIGAILPLSGDAANLGEMAKRGIDLAVDEINTSGGIKGTKIKMIYENTKAYPQKGVSTVRKLVTRDKVPVIIGGISSAVVLAIAPTVNEYKVILISPTASAPAITHAGEYVFRNYPSTVFEGEFLAKLAYNELDLRQITILYINNEYGRCLREVFTLIFKRLGGKIPMAESYDANATDFRMQLTKIKDKNPEAVYLISHSEDAALILKQAREIGIKAKFLTTSAIEDPKLIKLAGDAAEGSIYSLSSGYDPESNEEIVQEFKRKFMAQYSKKPNYVAAQAYDAMKIVTLAIERGGTRGAGIRAAIANIKDFPGVTGKTSFDENGDVIKSIVIKIVKNGKFMLYP